ncbi:ribonuclease P protein component [Candidatus Woesebacteria bacterium RIFCSPLOWO2_01_FULL_39_61]|uniref:Ribonuclease P protein component n=1 Tax=Candidatus Woesebacteria bacterium RIFCSPHIGHO2_02_FULL_39_13 TaxID=1802505 RepID=A0A1F7Z4F2_9BACT|nr:MAG: ribonuclease P protein component [Candidatus Woesebacteria bacterium RIFCSPHIGHO2_01_FULL_39_95]OGM34553.1 MAG: ribonuclease P protein component [Candidatus Woesebacteria bacterium RIFCSPHIGHO2_02_FULL_39_13]OGM38820.1 MAG: ribonuclease P protein component [Candidatus Woesebacteria bacterium RIFCSPHIGHO2_12_FULL_40_20]OGM65826.1 MAG: ribonuclease P protein component [Candidatus Woesebacteria bacterium RIFCSPLOWO2_01_FULL_39_61]OGM71640.1 MAG: ribonuclease P protein component [Candidatus
MLTREYKLHRKDEFERVKQKGKVFQSENFGARVLKRSDKGKPRFGFIISTKISKMAVHRNRVMRAFNEAMRQNLIMIPKGYDFVFLVKRGIMKKTVEEIMTEIKSFLQRAEFLD